MQKKIGRGRRSDKVKNKTKKEKEIYLG